MGNNESLASIPVTRSCGECAQCCYGGGTCDGRKTVGDIIPYLKVCQICKKYNLPQEGHNTTDEHQCSLCGVCGEHPTRYCPYFCKYCALVNNIVNDPDTLKPTSPARVLRAHTTAAHLKVLCKVHHGVQKENQECPVCSNKKYRTGEETKNTYWTNVQTYIGKFKSVKKEDIDFDCDLCVKDGVKPAHYSDKHVCNWCRQELLHTVSDCGNKCQYCVNNGEASNVHDYYGEKRLHYCRICHEWSNHTFLACPERCKYCITPENYDKRYYVFLNPHSTKKHRLYCAQNCYGTNEEMDEVCRVCGDPESAKKNGYWKNLCSSTNPVLGSMNAFKELGFE